MYNKKGGEKMIYQTSCKIINKNSEPKLYNYCQNQCEGAKLLKNATIFRCRQLLFAHDKQYQDLLEHQIEVIKEFVDNTTDIYKKIGNDISFKNKITIKAEFKIRTCAIFLMQNLYKC